MEVRRQTAVVPLRKTAVVGGRCAPAPGSVSRSVRTALAGLPGALAAVDNGFRNQAWAADLLDHFFLPAPFRRLLADILIVIAYVALDD